MYAQDSGAINFAWLVRLRFGAIAGQIVTILIVDYVMEILIPVGILAAVIAVELASNVAAILYSRSGVLKIREWHLAALLSLDVVLLTALLYLTGGPYNPFSFLYLVHIALAAVVLPPRLSWVLVAQSAVLFGLLFVDHRPLRGSHEDLHVRGMFVAFGVAAAFIVYFVQRVAGALAARDRELMEQRKTMERSAKLASLASLAAGAAHELSTPLSTIAVVATELERGIERGSSKESAIEDARLIRGEVERCRGILRQMSAGAGQSTGEQFVEVPLRELVGSALAELTQQERARVEVLSGDDETRVEVPLQALAQALRAVVKNGIQASNGAVTMRATQKNKRVELAVVDQGVGIAPENLERVGEPFFTTKEPGQGQGLGLFLTRTLLERLGGGFEIESVVGRGTRAVIVLVAKDVQHGT
jgi:two-component system sensor histidine kinase RegB